MKPSSIQVKAQEELRDKVGSPAKREVQAVEINEELKSKVEAFAKEKMLEISREGSAKHERSALQGAFRSPEGTPVRRLRRPGELSGEVWGAAKRYFDDLQYHTVRDMILDEGRPPRRPQDRRGARPRYGSGLPAWPARLCPVYPRRNPIADHRYPRHSEDELLVESAAVSDYSKFILHYNFPPFSTGEVKPQRGPGRREVGHGNLAKRSLEQMMPGKEYPYTVRIVSDILESNGSSSMATVCAGSLALMDAGVPFPKHVSGVAMGLISRAATISMPC